MPKNQAATIAGAFAVLGIEPTATYAEAKKAFRKLSLAAHPDKGGNVEKMVQINLAWEKIEEAFAKSDRKASNLVHEEEEDSGVDCENNSDNDDDGEDIAEEEEEDASVDEAGSDGDYQFEGDGDSTWNSDAETAGGSSDGGESEEDAGASYKVVLEDGSEITMEEHRKICRCNPRTEGSIHHVQSEDEAMDEDEPVEEDEDMTEDDTTDEDEDATENEDSTEDDAMDEDEDMTDADSGFGDGEYSGSEYADDDNDSGFEDGDEA